MVIQTGNYCLDVDVERTGAYYSGLNGTGCDCAGCRNYDMALPQLAQPVRAFLAQFGIDPQSPMEMSVLHSPDGKKTIYDGFFHICGRILQGREPWIPTGPKSRRLDPRYLIEVNEDCSAYILEQCALVRKDFPRPVIQLHISFALPWVLEDANSYRYD